MLSFIFKEMDLLPEHWVKNYITIDALVKLEHDPQGVKSSVVMDKKSQHIKSLLINITTTLPEIEDDNYIIVKERKGDNIGNWLLRESCAKKIPFAVFIWDGIASYYLGLVKSFSHKNGYKLSPIRNEKENNIWLERITKTSQEGVEKNSNKTPSVRLSGKKYEFNNTFKPTISKVNQETWSKLSNLRQKMEIVHSTKRTIYYEEEEEEKTNVQKKKKVF
jgi:hypothetical protein